MTIRRTLIASLAAAALISPAAQAEPSDMHASTALAAAKARAQAEAEQSPRTPDAQAPQRSGSTAGAPATDDGSPVPVIPIVAGVLSVLIAALSAHYGRRRSSGRSRIAA